MRRIFRVPARYAAEIEAAVVAAVQGIEKDQQEPGQHVAPFMVHPKREGEVMLVLVIPDVGQQGVVSSLPLQPQSHVA